MTSKYLADAVLMPSTKEFPKYIALVHRIAEKAFALKLQNPAKVVCKKTIETGYGSGHMMPFKVHLYTSASNVCDAAYVRNFYVRFGDKSLPEEYARRFYTTLLSFLIEGEPVVPETSIRELLEKKEIVFADPGEKFTLLLACAIDYESARMDFGKSRSSTSDRPVDRSGFLGYMIPNGTVFEVKLEGVPCGGGPVDLEVGWDLPEYTTKPEPCEEKKP